MDKAKAQELINQLQDNHKEQIQCLQALFGLTSQGQANEDQDKAKKVEGDMIEDSTATKKSTGVVPTTPALHTSATDDAPLEKDAQMPAENERLSPAAVAACEEASFTCPPMSSCLIVFCSELGVVDPTDSAARFIADNALKDLARFNSNRDITLVGYAAEFDRRKFYLSAFTIPYFSVTNTPPDREEAPLCPSGVFSSSSTGETHICERKFSVSWTGCYGTDEPSLMLVLSPLSDYMSESLRRRCKALGTSLAPPGIFWIEENLFRIVQQWEEVLDALDAQVTLSSSMIFDGDARQELLFDDRNFSNSKKYFWALQSLKIFAEYIDGTLRTISPILFSAKDYDASPKDHETRQKFIDEYRTKFETLRDRIERKRQEVQVLRDGVGVLNLPPGYYFING
ncbi:MAG: hypothetical protein Q9215_002632 [Flavoplaca cf. flavocitrina]